MQISLNVKICIYYSSANDLDGKENTQISIFYLLYFQMMENLNIMSILKRFLIQGFVMLELLTQGNWRFWILTKT